MYRIIERRYSSRSFYSVEFKLLFWWSRPNRIGHRSNSFDSEEELVRYLDVLGSREESPTYTERVCKVVK